MFPQPPECSTFCYSSTTPRGSMKKKVRSELDSNQKARLPGPPGNPLSGEAAYENPDVLLSTGFNRYTTQVVTNLGTRGHCPHVPDLTITHGIWIYVYHAPTVGIFGRAERERGTRVGSMPAILSVHLETATNAFWPLIHCRHHTFKSDQHFRFRRILQRPRI